ncbi:high-affinity nickel-transporter [Methanoregula boonei 6A8]|jgi:high-affinity nickel-transport protein|uniref:Nickel/cobalt efflux system n=1 Tax=Methanoregula boonei (strain DSM 21154 / JCM 14090 / 6A8) TaxID=456442 RepID=A7I6Y2_METB6|nr:HoxN/HupN/NixA family nickel/cobalt transporter [Methanoregula boonei]ABS55493.1 high-affinity nickel-transporter [Methanoregula boonei 6A8]
MTDQNQGYMKAIISLSGKEKLTIISIYVILAVASIIAFLLTAWIGQMYLVLGGLGVMAFVLGLRHGVDADHIAAIDNTTRKLLQEGKKPITVGMWFSIGHAVVVGVMVLSLVFAAKSILGTYLESGTDNLSTLISGAFLFIIGIINVIIVLDTYRIFKGLKNGTIKQAELDCELSKNGFMNTHFGWLFKIVQKPYQMFVVGFLFGLGFDTATEMMLIGVSVGAGVSSNVPLWAILTLPFAFACGMIITDTTDGISMRLAYGWAFQHPIRKVYYNLTITIMSVLVAFVIGGIELLQVISTEMNWGGPLWAGLNALDFETLGFGIIAIFLISWLTSIAYYRYKGYEKEFDKTLGGDCIPSQGFWE